jgi:signal transduction histidine kinase/ActR/RegA family two-component response regulator
VRTLGSRVQSREFLTCVLVLATSTGIAAIVALFLPGYPLAALGAAAAGALTMALPASDWVGAERKALDETRRQLEGQVRHLKAALEEANDAADQAHAARGQFLAAMNHELRTPLNSIIGFAQLLEMQGVSDDQRESLRPILRSGRQLMALVNELLEIAKIETDRLELSPEPVLIRELVAEVVDLMRPAAAHRNVALAAEGVAGPDRFVKADRFRLKQVLLNLVSNAVKFNVGGGRATVTLSTPAAGRVRLSVADTGPGLRPSDLARIFIPFDRLDAGRQGIEGTGLGLPLAKGLITHMGGAIGVDSTSGSGSTFRIELDETSAPGTHSATRPVAAHAAVGKAVVLQIDDNVANTDLIEHVLSKRPGIEVMTALQGRLGVELARDHRPSVILLDLNLPDLHGLQVLRALSTDGATADIPVIVISADVTPGLQARALALGARGVLEKPIDIPKFLDLVDDAVSASQEASCRPVQ